LNAFLFYFFRSLLSKTFLKTVSSIWCDHHLPYAVQHISFASSWSGCLLWPLECWSTPLQWLCKVIGYWQDLEHAVM